MSVNANNVALRKLLELLHDSDLQVVMWSHEDDAPTSFTVVDAASDHGATLLVTETEE